MQFKGVLISFWVLALIATVMAQQKPNDQSSVDARRQQLKELLHEHWEYTLRTNPEFASILGDKRYNDKLSDASYEAVQKDLAAKKEFLTRFENIDTTGFPEQETLNKTLMIRNLREDLDEAKFRPWEMPVNQFTGLQVQIPSTVSMLPFTNVKDYEDYITRLKGLPKVFDDVTDLMRRGLTSGRVPPGILLNQVTAQCSRIAEMKPEESPFAAPVTKFPAGISEADQKRLRAAVIEAVRGSVQPMYAKFAKFVDEEYAPKGRTEVGMWALPQGEAWYAFRVQQSTTTNLSPEQIHQIGLQQVAANHAEMLKIANKFGYKDLKSFDAAIKQNPELRPKSGEQMLELYRNYIDAMWAKLPQLFGHMPKAKMEVDAVEKFREKEAAGAEYRRPAPDGSRPGRVMVNTSDLEKRTTVDVETTAYHEGVPGHHLQLAISQELPALPPFRQQGYYTAYIEGWALYSERLGKEVGFFKDPYSDYGRLQADLMRAIRLVVDTGLHHKRWTRQQVVDYFHNNSGIDEPTVQSETDRYIAWPAQALGYKVGQLRLLELRARAEKELGPQFDIRAFHDTLLGAGALPLDVVERRVNEWIERKKEVARAQ
ncbi:MAG TPA: DUF885 family protein [Terriglobales bacterium]|nr:DUF885 family protein [Terriglobales bacterium]